MAGEQLAEKGENEHENNELEKVCKPIVSKLYQGAAPGSSNDQAGGSSQGPTTEEVDSNHGPQLLYLSRKIYYCKISPISLFSDIN